MERRGLHAALLLSLLCGALLVCARPGPPGRPALSGTVGLGSLALFSESVWGRGLSDGSHAEVPAGPCVHTLCDAVAPPRPPAGRVYTLRVLR